MQINVAALFIANPFAMLLLLFLYSLPLSHHNLRNISEHFEANNESDGERSMRRELNRAGSLSYDFHTFPLGFKESLKLQRVRLQTIRILTDAC